MKEYYKKLFYFSNENTKDILENRINEIAEIKHCTFSNIIENILLEKLLPEKNEAKNIVMDFYSNDSRFNTISSTLERLFEFNASGIMGQSRYGNFLPVINFCMETLNSNKTAKIEDEFYDIYLKGQLEQVVAVIEASIRSENNEHQNAYLESQSDLLKKILRIEMNCAISFVKFLLNGNNYKATLVGSLVLLILLCNHKYSDNYPSLIENLLRLLRMFPQSIRLLWLYYLNLSAITR